MKRIGLILVFLSLSCAPRVIVKGPALYQEEWQEKEIKIPESSLKNFSGEEYTYAVKWLGFTVGEIEFHNLGLEKYKGREVCHIVVRAKTNKLLKYLFRVEDEINSYMDSETLKPVLLKVKRKEGKYRADYETYFDYENKKIVHIALLTGEKKETDLPPDAYGTVSWFYKFRTLDLTAKNYDFTVMQRTKKWLLSIKIVKKGVLEIRKHGVLNAFLVEVSAQSGKEKAKGQAWLWFGADKKKPLLLGQFNVDIPVVGTVIAALQ